MNELTVWDKLKILESRINSLEDRITRIEMNPNTQVDKIIRR